MLNADELKCLGYENLVRGPFTNDVSTEWEGGVINPENLADVICGQPLTPLSEFVVEVSCGPCISVDSERS